MSYAAADNSLASAVSIEAKEVGADRQSSDAACKSDYMLSECSNSKALSATAAAQSQRRSQAATPCKPSTDLQHLQPSACTSAEAQADQSHNAERATPSVLFQPLSPEPEPFSPEPEPFSSGPQSLGPQAEVQASEHALPDSLSAGSSKSKSSSASKRELAAPSPASMSAAAAAARPVAADALLGAHTLQTDTAAAGAIATASAHHTGLLRDVSHSIADTVNAVDGFIAAPASREGSLSHHSSRSSSTSSSEQSWSASISEQDICSSAAPSSSRLDSSGCLLKTPVTSSGSAFGERQMMASRADSTGVSGLHLEPGAESLQAGIDTEDKYPASVPAGLLGSRTDEGEDPLIGNVDSQMLRSREFHPEVATASESEFDAAHSDAEQQQSLSKHTVTGKDRFAICKSLWVQCIVNHYR